ncbi:MAG: hypothetical protein HY517_04300, partial [Candidatus Aenigmarchaeota archaeon]|nr:hypothetical protein [Candidatus Aenigmarchaeota archaeon]
MPVQEYRTTHKKSLVIFYIKFFHYKMPYCVICKFMIFLAPL